MQVKMVGIAIIAAAVYNMYINHLNTAAKKSLCKVTQRGKYPGSSPFFLYQHKGIAETAFIQEKRVNEANIPSLRTQRIHLFLVTINFDYKDFFYAELDV